MNRMIKPSKKGGPLDAFDWSEADAIVERIPRSRWGSYGDVAVAAELPRSYAKAFGHHLVFASTNGSRPVTSPKSSLGSKKKECASTIRIARVPIASST